MDNDARKLWDSVYQVKAPDGVSWYRPHLETSLQLIRRIAPDPAASIIDVGGGESTLVDDLLTDGYRDITVLDISAVAVEVTRNRLRNLADSVTWIADDVTRANFLEERYDVWHDRAVFHFLTRVEDRRAYVERVARSMKHGGHVIVATFGLEGPTQCSGLDVVRYDSASLHAEFGKRFRLLNSNSEIHHTPFGTTQQFLYCLCRIE